MTTYRIPTTEGGEKIRGLLTPPDSNPKTAKGRAKGYATWVLHLAPADATKWQTCPGATEGCRESCLFRAGRASFDKNVNPARVRRTKWFFEEREGFMARLHREIESKVKLAKGKGWTPVFRLNGTSDIRWETVGFTDWRGNEWACIFDAFPNVQFYDYTKLPNRRLDGIDNYHLTFSLAESNAAWAYEAAQNGYSVAVVFRDELPESFALGDLEMPVKDGDRDDLRFLDGDGVVVGLKAKGPAKDDCSGFVHDEPCSAPVDQPVRLATQNPDRKKLPLIRHG